MDRGRQILRQPWHGVAPARPECAAEGRGGENSRMYFTLPALLTVATSDRCRPGRRARPIASRRSKPFRSCCDAAAQRLPQSQSFTRQPARSRPGPSAPMLWHRHPSLAPRGAGRPRRRQNRSPHHLGVVSRARRSVQHPSGRVNASIAAPAVRNRGVTTCGCRALNPGPTGIAHLEARGR